MAALPALIDTLEKGSVVATPDGPVRVVGSSAAPLTERERLQAARIGQGEFRNALIGVWNGRCPIAGVDHLELLRVSHIKPWAASSDAERLDPFNGLLLCAHIDALFDRGLISFFDDGRMLVSSSLSIENRQRLSLGRDQALLEFDDRHLPYLCRSGTLASSSGSASPAPRRRLRSAQRGQVG